MLSKTLGHMDLEITAEKQQQGPVGSSQYQGSKIWIQYIKLHHNIITHRGGRGVYLIILWGDTDMI